MQKKGEQNYRIGPGAASLLMIVVVLSLTVLGILALIGARNDHKLSLRNQEMVSAYYDASSQAQEALLRLDAVLFNARKNSADEGTYLEEVLANLPEGFELDGQTARYEADAGANRTLTLTVEVKGLVEKDRYRVKSVFLNDETTWETQLIEGLITLE